MYAQITLMTLQNIKLQVLQVGLISLGTSETYIAYCCNPNLNNQVE